MKLYHIEVTERVSRDGVATWETVGDSVIVDGVMMVRLAHGTITHAKDFTASRAVALRRAADSVDELRLRMRDQSERFRSEAARIEEVAT